MSSTDPTNPRWPEPPRVNIWRWLSPLLLVSLGLHGVSLLIPINEKREAIEREEIEEEAISIQVADLPPGALKPEPLPTEAPLPPPVEQPPPPAPIEQPPVEQLPLPAPAQPVFTQEPPLLDPNPPGPTPATPSSPGPPTQQARVAPKSGSEGTAFAAAFRPADPATGGVDGFAIMNGFTPVDVALFRKLTDVLTVQFEPNENDNICLSDPPPDPLVASFLATVAEENGIVQINDAQILGRTGYDVVDDWIADSLIGFSDSDTVTPASVYSALSSTPGVQPSSGSGFETYYFEIDITLPPDIACT
ncbi:MAG: hypothetical protein AAFQ95_07435 [Cyanobacteria bacterium J06621_3]